jgi:hypothetical protein
MLCVTLRGPFILIRRPVNTAARRRRRRRMKNSEPSLSRRVFVRATTGDRSWPTTRPVLCGVGRADGSFLGVPWERGAVVLGQIAWVRPPRRGRPSEGAGDRENHLAVCARSRDGPCASQTRCPTSQSKVDLLLQNRYFLLLAIPTDFAIFATANLQLPFRRVVQLFCKLQLQYYCTVYRECSLVTGSE